MKTCRLVPEYFRIKAVGKEDVIAIENLTLVLEGQTVKTSPQKQPQVLEVEGTKNPKPVLKTVPERSKNSEVYLLGGIDA